MKGGVGKTTLAVNIAHCLATRHQLKVLLIDIDPQFNATQCLMSPGEYIDHLGNERDTILNIFDSNTRPIVKVVDGIDEKYPKILESIEVIQVIDNFKLLPGNLELYRMEMSSGEGRENRLKKYLVFAAKENLYDFVIIDTPPTPSIWMTSALLASDFYLIPVKPDPISFTGIDLLQSIIESKKDNYDLRIKCAGVVLNMVDRRTIVYKDAVANLKSGKWAKYKYSKEIPQRTEIARTQTSKTFILDLSDSDSKIALTGIVDELISKVGNE